MEKVKQIWQCSNGEIEFECEGDLMEWLRGKQVELELIEGNRYKAQL